MDIGKKDNLNNSTKLGLLVLLILIIIGIIAMVVKHDNDREKDKKKKEEKINETESWEVPTGAEAKINIYMSEEDVVAIKEGDLNTLDNTYKIIGTYGCTLNTCTYYDVNKDKNEVIIKDDGYLLYNYKDNKFKRLGMPNAQYNQIEFLSLGKKDYGLSVSNINDLYAFYSLDSDKFTTEFKYTNILSEQTGALSIGNIIALSVNDGNYTNAKYYVVDYKTGKELLETDAYIGTINNGKYLYYYVNYSDDDNIDAMIYNEEYKLLLDGKRFVQFGVSKSGNLVVKEKDGNTFSIYNKSGNLVKTSKKYKQIGIILNDYVVVIDDDNYLKLINYDGNIITRFTKMNDNYYFHPELSYLYKKEGNDAICLVIENKAFEEGTKGNGLYFYYVFKTKEKGFDETECVNAFY